MTNLNDLKQIPGYDHYFASRDGEIYSTRCGKVKKIGKCIGFYGYKISILIQNKKRTTFSTHRLIATTFLGESNLVVNHKDGNKLNNNIENLEWCTIRENIYHAVKTGLINDKGELNPNAKLTEMDVIAIRLWIDNKLISQTALCKKTGIPYATISLVYLRKTWKHI